MLYNILIFGVILFAGNGPVAQLAERCICTAKVTGSNPVGSTKHWIIRTNISGREISRFRRVTESRRVHHPSLKLRMVNQSDGH